MTTKTEECVLKEHSLSVVGVKYYGYCEKSM